MSNSNIRKGTVHPLPDPKDYVIFNEGGALPSLVTTLGAG